MIKRRLNLLINKMIDEGIDICLIPTSDFHNSEYISDYFKVREYFSNFSGSAGTLIVSRNRTVLYTDGRYFIQAAKELENTGIELKKMGEPGVKKLNEYLISEMRTGGTIACDGRLISAQTGEMLKKIVNSKSGILIDDFDPAESIWEDRPEIKFHKLFKLENEFSGTSYKEKMSNIRKNMEENLCNIHIISSLDDIAWILNLRGNDIESCPLFFSYLIIDEAVTLYANIDENNEQNEKINVSQKEIIDYINENGIILKKYSDFYIDLIKRVNNGTKNRILLDKTSINYRILSICDNENNVLIDQVNPSTLYKCIKNDTELKNIENANIKDGIAMLRFLMWLNTKTINENVSELEVADLLYKLRSKASSFIECSFDTIAGFGANGAIVHYSASDESNTYFGVDNSNNLLLVDSGGHYYEGTTDVTRTYSIGTPSYEMKSDYTLVLRAMLKLLNCRVPVGSRGANLDSITRSLMWEKGRSFNHGTGHGIGYLLNVHEGPVRISWQIPDGGVKDVPFRPGMLTSNEPGLYVEGSYGIRIENDMVCVKSKYDGYLEFRAVTYVPIDTSLVCLEEMDDKDKKYLNSYHQLVYSKLSPYLEGEELKYLKEVTKKI